jgi:hypothetical protein
VEKPRRTEKPRRAARRGTLADWPLWLRILLPVCGVVLVLTIVLAAAFWPSEEEPVQKPAAVKMKTKTPSLPAKTEPEKPRAMPRQREP